MAARTLLNLFLPVAVLCSIVAVAPLAQGEVMGASSPSASKRGAHVFKSTCAGCHKWHGGGGGGYGGAALSLRSTHLNKEQIIEVVSCGRPGTGMPHHARDAYKDKSCYGMDKQEIGALMPPGAASDLSKSEIAAVADYVVNHVKGKGAPTLQECEKFWGPTSRICNSYRRRNATEASSRKQAADGGKGTR